MNLASITTPILCIILSGCMSQSENITSQRMQAYNPDIVEDDERNTFPSREDDLKSLSEDILNIIAEDAIHGNK